MTNPVCRGLASGERQMAWWRAWKSGAVERTNGRQKRDNQHDESGRKGELTGKEANKKKKKKGDPSLLPIRPHHWQGDLTKGGDILNLDQRESISHWVQHFFIS